MPEFDTKAFEKATFEPRTAEVEVKELAAFFPDGEASVFVVRGLSHDELAAASEAVENARAVGEIVGKLVGGSATDKADAVASLMGIDGSTPPDSVRRIAHLKAGCIDPVLDQQQIVRLSDAFPVPFITIANKIMELTGLGKTINTPGKSKPSGETQLSKTA